MKKDGDTIGGIVETLVGGVPVGLDVYKRQESDTYLNKIKGLDGLFRKSWSLLIKTFLKSFSSKLSNTVVLIMQMKRRQPFVFLTKREMVLVVSRLTCICLLYTSSESN